MTVSPMPGPRVSPLDRLLIAALPHRLHMGLTLVARVGLSPAEALSLTWDQVDATGSRLCLPRRDVRISAPLQDLLSWHAARQRFDARTAGNQWAPDGLVVADREGRPFTVDQADAITADLAEEVGLPPNPMSALRHPALR